MNRFVLIIFLAPLMCFAKAGPEVELPKISYSEAVTLGQGNLSMSGCIIGKAEDYILSSLSYIRDDASSPMYWSVKFIHPKFNDHTVTFKIENNKRIKVVRCTK